jgi:GxxExxY protein
LKAIKAITAIDEAQILNYLKATGFERGLLVNFGCPSLEFKRFVFSASKKGSDLNVENSLI